MAQLKHNATFEELLADEARRFKQAAEEQPPGSTARESLLRRARQAETASRMNDWRRRNERVSRLPDRPGGALRNVDILISL